MPSFPTSIPVLTNPSGANDLDDVTVLHSAQHANANDEIEAIAAKVGVNGSAVTSSLDYKLTNAASADPGHTHTLYVPKSLVDAKGDLLVGSAADTVIRVAIGTNDHVLTADSTQPGGLKWAASPAGIQATLFDAKGDLIVASAADTAARLAAGTDGHVLVADSAQSTGLKYEARPTLAGNTFTAEQVAPDYSASGLTGATAGGRFVGATSSGAPASGTFAVGDFIIDRTGKMWVCTAAGSPGTWVQIGGGGGIVAQSQRRITSGDWATGSLGFGWKEAFGTAEDITLAASTGDRLQVGVAGIWNNAASDDYIDVKAVTSGTHLSGQGGASGVGYSAWMAKLNATEFSVGGSMWYTVDAGDISGGNVALRIVTRTGGGRTLRANTTQGFYFFAANFGQP